MLKLKKIIPAPKVKNVWKVQKSKSQAACTDSAVSARNRSRDSDNSLHFMLTLNDSRGVRDLVTAAQTWRRMPQDERQRNTDMDWET